MTIELFPIVWIIGIGCFIHFVHEVAVINDFSVRDFLTQILWSFVRNFVIFITLIVIFIFMVAYIRIKTGEYPERQDRTCRSQTTSPADLTNC